MPDLFLIATGQDTGGWNWRIREAFRRQRTDWVARSMAATRTYIAYPEDLPYRREQLLELYASADAIHLQNHPAGWELYDNGAGKPTVLQHHGTIFRDDHEALSAVARRVGMVEIASTLDLVMLEPSVTWVPVPYDLGALQAIRQRVYQPKEGVIRIAHAPTNRAVKGTATFLAVVDRLRAKGHRIEVVLIEQRAWAQCLALKAQADIYYDQMELGYGCNAVEAWGMGMPVVAGVADPAVQATMLERWGRWPFAFAQPDTLEATLEQLVTSPAARAVGAAVGREHFDRWHDERTVAAQLADIYSGAPATEPGPVRAAKRVIAKAQRRQERAERARSSLARALARRDATRASRAAL